MTHTEVAHDQGAGNSRSLDRLMSRQMHGAANRNQISVSVLLRRHLRMQAVHPNGNDWLHGEEF
jgi:hypothetical protein